MDEALDDHDTSTWLEPETNKVYSTLLNPVLVRSNSETICLGSPDQAARLPIHQRESVLGLKR